MPTMTMKRCRRWGKWLVKLKLVVIAVVLAGRVVVHFELVAGMPAKVIEFGADSLHLVFSGIAELFV